MKTSGDFAPLSIQAEKSGRYGKIRLVVRCFIFDGLKESTREALAEGARVRSCVRGEVIYRAKEPADCICFQIRGKSILYNLTHSGSRKIIFILGPGELLNDHVLNEHETSLFCEAIEKGSVLEISVSVFLKTLR